MAPAIPVITAVAGAVGTAAAVHGALETRKAKKAAAAQAEANARAQEKATKMQIAQEKRQNFLRLGAIRARGGSNRVGYGGSISDLLMDQERQSQLMQTQIAEGGANKAANYMSEAEAERGAASQALVGGLAQGASTGAGAAWSSYDQWKRING